MIDNEAGTHPWPRMTDNSERKAKYVEGERNTVQEHDSRTDKHE